MQFNKHTHTGSAGEIVIDDDGDEVILGGLAPSSDRAYLPHMGDFVEPPKHRTR